MWHVEDLHLAALKVVAADLAELSALVGAPKTAMEASVLLCGEDGGGGLSGGNGNGGEALLPAAAAGGNASEVFDHSALSVAGMRSAVGAPSFDWSYLGGDPKDVSMLWGNGRDFGVSLEAFSLAFSSSL